MGKRFQNSRLGLKIKRRILIRRTVFVMLGMLLAAAVQAGRPAHALDLADTPMLALVKSPPANIMFVLDESGSMTFEILIKGQNDGRYPSPNDTTGENGFCYIFDYLGDNAYEWDDDDGRWEGDNLRYMREEYRTYWRSQYFGDNFMYYNPNFEYLPWTPYGSQTFPDADREYPKPHPTKSGVRTLDLDGKSFSVKLKIDDVTESDLDVKNAHFFNKSEQGDIYLVVLDGFLQAIKYYKVIETEGIGYAEKVTKIEEINATGLPDGIAAKNDYDKERQNFANWFTYHRRREYVAKAALARVIKNLKGVRVGILGINGKIIVPLKPVNAKINGIRLDESDALLAKLYAYDSRGGTPLREGLKDVGTYYRTNSKKLIHFNGTEVEGDTPPYFSEDEGGACQQSFAVLMTDGYYSTTGNIGVGNADGPADQTLFDRPALEDGLSNTLADVAMYFYENDLSPQSNDTGLADHVPTFGFDVATHQHMVTFGVAFGVDGNLNPAAYLNRINQIYNDDEFTVPWPQAIRIRQPETIDDLWHATLNGRGQFYSADNPQELTASLLELTETISGQLSGSASSVTINGSQLYKESDDDTLLYQCSYSNENENEEWLGDVKAYGFSAATGSLDTDSHVWSAIERLQLKAWNERRIATYDPGYYAGIAFEYENLTTEQKKALGWDEITGSQAEQTARNRVDYIKGKEIDGFRSRSQKLGDIVHSAPVFENDVIYVGANDGMVHAFNTKKFDPKEFTDPALGDELFAYIPNLVFANLAELTQVDYDHRYFVDLTPTVKKGAGLLEGKSPSESEVLSTILVGGLGKGGKGYFALDITEPFAMNTTEKVAQKVLWEFPSGSDADMGFSYSKPAIVRSYDKNHPWIVIFGNGYGSTSGKAVLYILDPAKEPENGLLIKRFDMGGGPDNGLSSPTPVDVNWDNVVDYVYAGDLKGNLWKFDLTAGSYDNWDFAYYRNPTTPEPLFQATGPGDTPQPITTKPEVTLHPQFGYLVLFGTGKFLGDVDFGDNSVQSVYGIWDFGDDEDDSEYLGTLQRGKTQELSNMDKMVSLVKQEVSDFVHALPNGKVVNVRVLTQKEPQWIVENDDSGQNPNPSITVANNAGWYFDLPPRERVDQDPLLREGKLIVIGWMPDAYQCTPGGGNSMFMEIDAFSGGNLSLIQFDLTGGGILNEFDYVNNPAAVDSDTAALIPPSGLLFRGKLQKPAILLINPAFRRLTMDDDHNGLDKPAPGSTGCGEEKYLSTSTGQIRTICERSVSLGIGYWKEVGRDE